MPKLLTCGNCGGQFSGAPTIDGIRRNLYKRKYCLVCSPFGQHNTRPIKKQEDNSEFNKKVIETVPNCTSIQNLICTLGMAKHTNSYKKLRKIFNKCNVDISHFKPIRSNGRTPPTLEELMVENSQQYSTTVLKDRLFKANIFEKKCYECNLTKWRDSDIPLELHHINGINNDNRLENLKVVCCNCHALTENWKGKARNKK